MSPMIYTVYGFAIFFFVFWCGKWLLHVLAISYGKYKLHRRPKTPVKISPNQVEIKEATDQQQTQKQQEQQSSPSMPPSASAQLSSTIHLVRESPLPSISILKPLLGVDPNLQQNLETFFTMNYHTYELLFCIEDKSDPAVSLVEMLMQKYPMIDSKLFIGGSDVGVNPKINNMYPGYEAARYELVMISDSGIRMKEDTLLDMVDYMTSKVGLVHQMPFTCDREGFAATFEKIFFGTVQSRIYLAADLLGINCHTGMSCLMRKSVLEELGGLQAFGCYLAEDFFIAQAFLDNGWKLAISSQPAWQNSGICDINSFQARLMRWVKLRIAMLPKMILLEPLSECMLLGALASWSVSILFHWDALVFYLVHILMWLLSDWLMLSIVQNGTLPFNKFEFVVGWLLRECTGPYLFCSALWNPAIRWRERVFRLAWGGIAYEITSENSENSVSAINDEEAKQYMPSSSISLSTEGSISIRNHKGESNIELGNMWIEKSCSLSANKINEEFLLTSQHRNTGISISVGMDA